MQEVDFKNCETIIKCIIILKNSYNNKHVNNIRKIMQFFLKKNHKIITHITFNIYRQN